jgi:hypothetical protein
MLSRVRKRYKEIEKETKKKEKKNDGTKADKERILILIG